MRKPVFFTFLLLFLYTSLNAQSEKKQGGWTATLTAALIPISQPGLGIQPGVEYRFNKRFSLLAEITFPVNHKNSKDSSELNKKYMRYKTEIRYNFFSKKEKSQLYAGLQVSRSSRSFINQDGFYFNERKGDSVYYYDKASIRSPVATVSLQLGSIISSGRFAFDIFGGIGARFIHTSITDIVNPVTGIRSRGGSGLSLTASYSYSGNVTMLHLNGGIRLMWHFYQSHRPEK
jgi:Outer membrane protein beta-barrel domain